MLMSLFHKNNPEDPFNLVGAYLKAQDKQIRSYSIQRRMKKEKEI